MVLQRFSTVLYIYLIKHVAKHASVFIPSHLLQCNTHIFAEVCFERVLRRGKNLYTHRDGLVGDLHIFDLMCMPGEGTTPEKKTKKNISSAFLQCTVCISPHVKPCKHK